MGFHVEKGVSEIAGEMLSLKNARKLCIKPDWAWNSMFRDLLDGKLENRLKEISDAINKRLIVSLRASNVTSEYDPYSEKIEGFENDHTMAFEYADGNFQILQDEFKGEMQKYRNLNKLADLTNVFQEKDLEWFWIDLFVTARVEGGNETEINEIALNFLKYYPGMFGVEKNRF